MGPFMKSLLLLLTTVVVGGTTLKCGKASSILLPKTTVIIQNLLSEGEDLLLHCRSKDDDLGEQTIKYGGTWSFRFRPRAILYTTLYHCQFWWPSHASPYHFNIYEEEREYWCKVCAWGIYDSAPCMSGTSLCYAWRSVLQRLRRHHLMPLLLLFIFLIIMPLTYTTVLLIK